MPNDRNFKYKAFISYSHKDRIWSEWLHKKLENYHLPKALRKKRIEEGKDVGRLRPIFRDREELPAHENMTAKILEAVRSAEYLIVVCSPNSVASAMVNEEIREFRKLNGNTNILCLITEGEPGVFNSHSNLTLTEAEAIPENACFPAALFETAEFHKDLPTAASNPLAADARAEGDGKRNAYLKIAAGMLGVNLGELVRRDFVKRQRQISMALAVSVGISAAMGWLAWTAIKEGRRAEQQQMEAEEFADYFADILVDELPKTGREDLIQGVVDRLLSYYDGLDIKSADALYRKGLAFTRIAHILDSYDQYQDYRRIQQQAIDIAEKLVSKHPKNTDYLFLKAQSNGSMALAITWKGEPEQAVRYSQIEKEILHRLLEIDPKNQDWLRTLGVSYTVSGLAHLQNSENIKAAESDYRKALEIRLAASKLPDAHNWALNHLGAAYVNMSVVHSVKGPISKMVSYAKQSRDTFESNSEHDPNSVNAHFVTARSERNLGHAERFAGDLAAALEMYEASAKHLEDLLMERPNNSLWKHTLNLVVIAYAETLITDGRYEAAARLIDKYSASIASFYTGTDVKNYHIAAYYHANYLKALFAYDRGDANSAIRMLDDILANLDQDRSANILKAARISNVYSSAYLTYGQILAEQGQTASANTIWREAIEIFDQNLGAKRMDIKANVAQIFLMLEEYEKAQQIIDTLERDGYREVAYVRAVDREIRSGGISAPLGWRSPVSVVGK
ncbi:toll/interleukin-1 receptor domain-containing protein [Kordiimonas sp. SCSIO 12610]|uniref:toll/interleukin-1 receptor domain-containing protein n=1 Tax=Kordiimonas sp. SCSIO 12610 TaxID=2829597 RepID=UPI002109A207|nr:toll/interleukin-1 receptor domain-containing protein [Kordiimonas sp. SCSIO 12610]UTW56319.1 TIR domain-containing protein [Kordiimonas sp. SCSIO 12610]